MPVLEAPWFKFEIAGKPLLVVRFSAVEAISALYEVDLELASEEEIPFEEVIGKAGILTIMGETDRFFHGIVNVFTKTGAKGRFFLYRARIVPSIWLLSLKQDCRIFQNTNGPDIIKKLLSEANVDRFEFRLQAAKFPREYCVQYRETDLDFLCRLLEEDGIFYFFEQAADKHTVVFGNSKVNYRPITGEPRLRFRAQGMVPGEEFVFSFSLARQIRSGKVTMRDFNYQRPSLDMTVFRQSEHHHYLEVYDYPGEYEEKDIGEKLAGVRLEEQVMFRYRGEGRSACPRLVPGFTFQMLDCEMEDLNREYLVVEVTHEGFQPQVLEEEASEDNPPNFSNRFMAVPSSVNIRPVRKTPKPVIKGPQTAMVVGPSGEEIYTDESGIGRVKVQFHWDREGRYDQNSSCWIRVSHNWAGAYWGTFFLPRIGQEVLVDFLEGDPDRPIVTGCTYNATALAPYKLPAEKTKSTIKTLSSTGGGGFNEVRFEDKKGQEQIFIHAEKDQDIRVKNELREWVGKDTHLIVKRDKLDLIEGDQHSTVKGDRNEKVGGTVSVTAGEDFQEKVWMKYAMDAGMEIHLKAGMNVVIEAGMSITLKAGGGFIVVGPAGVTISGTPILLNSGGSAGSGSGSSPEHPKTPKEADKDKPGDKMKKKSASPVQRTPPPCVQATVMREAARSGTPFCEKCAEAAKKR